MFCPACVRGPARKGSAADKKASAAALPVAPSRKPRTCGEKPKVMNLVLVRPGSPPHVRGKVIVDLVLTERHRITPACAGKSVGGTFGRGERRDHPRMCGEKPDRSRFIMCRMGSPPRMRGKEELARAVDSITGITPACAGKSKTFLGPADSCEDHPRMCGENLAVENKVNEPQGSPPHVRGKVRG